MRRKRSVGLFASERRDQSAARTGEPRHHSAYRHFSRLGDLAIVKAFDVTQHQRLAERRRQRRDCRAELFGVGVAFDIYFVMWWRDGGRNLLESPLTRAVLMSAGTTGAAFGTLSLSSHPGTASMGLLLMISLFWILVSMLIVLPALLHRVLPNEGLEKPAAPPAE